MAQFYPGRTCYHLCLVKTHQLGKLRRLHRTGILRKVTKLTKNIGLDSFIHNDVHLGLLIRTGRTQNKGIMSQTIIRTF